MPSIVTTDFDGATRSAGPTTTQVCSFDLAWKRLLTIWRTQDNGHLGVNTSARTTSRTSDTTYYTEKSGAQKEMDSPTSPSSDSDESTPKEKPSFIKRVFPFLQKKEVEAYKPKPDPSPEEMKPFDTRLTPSSLYNLIDPKNVDHLKELGGPDGILKGLGSDRKLGLQEGGPISNEERIRVYGANRIPERKSKTLLQLMWAAYQDKVLIVLSVAAVVSLALGIYQSVGAPPKTYESTRCPNNLCVETSVSYNDSFRIA